MTLSFRRSQMASKILGNHPGVGPKGLLDTDILADTQRSAEFDYRRDVVDDIENLLTGAGVLSGDDPTSRTKLRKLADSITTYILT